jgi:putative inorganic carbon (hco3(-)) transporter
MLRTLLILAILVPGLWLALKDRYAALLLYLWFAFFKPQDWIWIDLTSLRLSVLIGVLLLVPALATGIVPNVTHPMSIGAILFLASALIAQFHAVNASVGWQWIDYLVRLLIVCLIAVPLMSTRERFIGVIAVVGGSLGFHSAKAGLASLLAGGSRFGAGLAGSFEDSNGFALAVVMIIPLIVVLGQNAPKRWVRLGCYCAVPLCVLAAVGTFSRAGFLALCASTIVFVGLQRRRLAMGFGLAAVVTLLLLVAPIPKGYVDRIQTIETYEDIGEDSAMSRPHFWRVALVMVAANPFGVGLRNYDYAYDRFDFLHGRYGTHRAVHNSFFQALAEMGYLGFAIYAGLFVYAFRLGFQVRARSRAEGTSPENQQFLFTMSNALMTSMVGFMVGGSFIALMLNEITWLTFSLLMSLDLLSRVMCPEPKRAEPPLLRIPDPGSYRSLPFEPASAMFAGAGALEPSRSESRG